MNSTRSLRSKRWTASLFALCAAISVVLGIGSSAPANAQDKDLTANYLWKPVKIGGGGFVVGMVLHPLDPSIRYLRTDVGNAYRWDNANQVWIPMRVYNVSGSGIQSSSETSAPSTYGIDSIAVDPANKNIVYMVFPTLHSCDVQCPTNFVEIYKSVDGGNNFTPGGLGTASVIGNPNGNNRADGERLMVDPANTQVLYYGSDHQGLFRSLDGGATWTNYAAATGLPVNVEFINIQFAAHGGTTVAGSSTVSKVVYAVSIQNNGDGGGDVYQSTDGGQSWLDISAGVRDGASGQSLSGQASASSIDSAGNLYVVENSTTDGYHRAYWKYGSGAWSRISLEVGGVNAISQPLTSVAVDPNDASRVYVMGVDTSMSRSDDGGATWISFGEPAYENSFAWLPQTVGMNGGDWHSNGGLHFDAQGNLWVPTGQEGALTLASATAASATTAEPPQWTIVSTGIEELVAQDILIPQGSGDTIIAAAEDTTGFVIHNPDNFSAVQIPLQQEIIAQGTSVDNAPDVPSYIAITSSNVYTNGTNYSGYSTDGGATWQRFGSALQVPCGASKCDVQAGIVAVGLRGTRQLGSDHLVLLPPNNVAPEYSQDGGATWHVTSSFPLASDGVSLDTSSGTYIGFLIPELHQHLLRADPFTADRFYLKFLHAPFSLYVSTDGGQTWQGQANAALPDSAYHGQLVVNSKVKNDLWYADGWEGSSQHGIFHSTDGGATFSRLPGIAHAVTVAIGAASGNSGDAPYSVYFYGQLASDPAWGIYQSTDGGSTWNRIAYYPTGIYDRPNTMGASQDTFGKVYLGLAGDSFVYSQFVQTPVQPPGPPTALKAAAVSGTEIDLSWTAPAGQVQSYSVYRGTAASSEASTAFASGITSTSYADKSVVTGTQYFYTVAAFNSGGGGTQSNEASALAEQPSITLAPASGSQLTQTIQAGQTATFNLTLNSVNYGGTISFACQGTAVGQICTAPGQVTVTPSTTATNVTVTVTTTTATSNAGEQRRVGGIIAPLFAMLIPVFIGRKKRRSMAGLLILAACVLAISACNGGQSGGSSSQPVRTTYIVTASANGLASTSETLTLITQ